MNKIENVLNDDVLNELYEFTRNGKNVSSANFFKWQPQVVGLSNAIFIFDLTDELKNKIEYAGKVLKNISPDSFNTLIDYLTGEIKYIVKTKAMKKLIPALTEIY